MRNSSKSEVLGKFSERSGTKQIMGRVTENYINRASNNSYMKVRKATVFVRLLILRLTEKLCVGEFTSHYKMCLITSYE